MCTKEQYPGKFEGEPCITELADAWALDGMGEWVESQNGRTNFDMRFTGPFGRVDLDQAKDYGLTLCDECLSNLLAATSLTFWEDNNGFCWSELE